MFEKGELVEVKVSGKTHYGVITSGEPRRMYMVGEVYEVLIDDEVRLVIREHVKKLDGKKKKEN